MIITENKTGNKFKTIGAWKQIFFTKSGSPYFMWNGHRQHLDNIPRLSYPIMYHVQHEGDIDGVIGGYITISNCYGVLVEIHETGEAVRLYEEIEREADR